MTPLELNVRRTIEACRERRDFVERVVKAETAKPILERRRSLLEFLYKEREVFNFALGELEASLRDAGCAPACSE